jgi:hypothetical protein
MRRDSTLTRIAAAAYLVLAVTFSFVLPVAEARAGAKSLDAVAHVEAPDSEGQCPTAHDHWSCNICRALRLHSRSEPTPAVDMATMGVAPVADVVVAHWAFSPTASANPRAPPPPPATT